MDLLSIHSLFQLGAGQYVIQDQGELALLTIRKAHDRHAELELVPQGAIVSLDELRPPPPPAIAYAPAQCPWGCGLIPLLNLIDHIEYHRQELVAEAPVQLAPTAPPSIVEQAPADVRCDVCARSFLHERARNIHMARTHAARKVNGAWVLPAPTVAGYEIPPIESPPSPVVEPEPAPEPVDLSILEQVYDKPVSAKEEDARIAAIKERDRMRREVAQVESDNKLAWGSLPTPRDRAMAQHKATE